MLNAGFNFNTFVHLNHYSSSWVRKLIACLSRVSFRGQIKLEQRPDWFNSIFFSENDFFIFRTRVTQAPRTAPPQIENIGKDVSRMIPRWTEKDKK